MNEQLERIISEGRIMLTTRDVPDFKYYVRRMYAQGRTTEQLATVDGRDVAEGFKEMMA